MSGPRPGPRRLSLPLAVAALACFWLIPLLDMAPPSQRIVLPWTEAARASVRRVVIEPQPGQTHGGPAVEVQWRAQQPPGVRLSSLYPGVASLHWVQEGDTLYLRQVPGAATPAPEPKGRPPVTWRVEQLVLPPQVQQVQAPGLVLDPHAAPPPHLSLRASQISVYGRHAMAQLHLSGLVQRAPAGSDAGCDAQDGWRPERISLEVQDSRDIGQLRVELPAGTLSLNHVGTDTTIDVHASASAGLHLQRMQALPQVRWHPLAQAQLQDVDACAQTPVQTPVQSP